MAGLQPLLQEYREAVLNSKGDAWAGLGDKGENVWGRQDWSSSSLLVSYRTFQILRSRVNGWGLILEQPFPDSVSHALQC